MKHLDFLLWNTPAQQSSAAAARARVHVCRRIQLCWSHSWTGDHVCPGWWSQLNTAKRVFIRSSLQTKKSHLTANLMFVPPELAQRGRDGGTDGGRGTTTGSWSEIPFLLSGIWRFYQSWQKWEHLTHLLSPKPSPSPLVCLWGHICLTRSSSCQTSSPQSGIWLLILRPTPSLI